MYRERIREHYDRLSRSYRRVADFIMSRYYEVSFMTAAQLAQAVKVDTTTVVRFSQRLGYNGYPELLADVREQVRDEIFTAYEPKTLDPDDDAFTFEERVRQEVQNLNQMLVHSPPEHITKIAAMVKMAERILLVSEGYAASIAAMIAQQMRHRGVHAEAIEQDLARQAASLAFLQDSEQNEHVLFVGISAGDDAATVARVLQFARLQGCPTLGVVGSLSSSVNRMSDIVLYAPTETAGTSPSFVSLMTALSTLVEMCGPDDAESVVSSVEHVRAAYQYLAES